MTGDTATTTMPKPRRRLSRRARERLTIAILLLPAGLLLAGFVLFPFANVILMSFQRIGPGQLSGPYVGLSNYAWALDSPDFWRGIRNTLIWTFGATTLEMTLGLLFALALNLPLRLRGLARTLTLFSYLVPTIVAVLVWRYMFHDVVGIVNHMLRSVGLTSGPVMFLESPTMAMPSVIAIAAWKHFPFVVLILLAMLQSIPKEQYEAARIDGASRLQQFFHVTLPALLPVLMLTALLRIIYNINSFDIIYLLTGGGPVGATRTLPVLIFNKSFVDFQLGRGASVAILMFLVMLVFLAIYVWSALRTRAYEQ